MTKPTTLGALAVVVAEVSGGRWDPQGIAAALAKIDPGRPLAQIAAAAIYAAHVRTDQRTPAFLPLDGEHWRALDHLTGAITGPVTPEPARGCPYHPGQPKACPECARHARTIASPDQTAGHLAEIRAAIRAAQPDHRTEQPCPDPSATPPTTKTHPEPAHKSQSTTNSGNATASPSPDTQPSAASK